MTPAQASGHPNFVTDVPVQGPTDEGMRAADCLQAQRKLPAQPACVDCKGPIPMWAQTSVAFGNVGVRGFDLSGPGDPEVWSHLSAAQQSWIVDTLVKLNGIIVASTKTTCPTWAPAIDRATGCFQGWFNGAKFGFTKANGAPLVLRTDSVFDQDTLDALRTVAALNPKDFTTAFPGTELPGTGVVKKKLSTGAIAGIATAGAAAIGTVAYLATRKKSRRRR